MSTQTRGKKNCGKLSWSVTHRPIRKPLCKKWNAVKMKHAILVLQCILKYREREWKEHSCWQMAGLNLEPALWARPSEPPVRKEPVGQHHYEAGKKDWREGMKQREGRRQRGLRGRRWRKRVVESHYAAQWLWPDYSRRRPRGHCPPLGRNPLAEWKISVEHPGNDTNTLRRTKTHTNMHAHVHSDCDMF